MRELFATLRGATRAAAIGREALAARRATTQAARDAAKKRLAARLAEGRGIALKAGQLLGTLGAGDDLEALVDGVPPLPLQELLPTLRRSLGADFATLYPSLDPVGRSASLGQVHVGRRRDGAEVALKVKLPGIDAAVAAELRLLRALPAGGPFARWGFDRQAYLTALQAALLEELDYPAEAARQERLRAALTEPGLVIPEVLAATDEVIVQRREDGVSLKEAQCFPPLARLRMAHALLGATLRALFSTGELHADPHPGNLRARLGPQGGELVLYDYGSTLRLAAPQRQALLGLVLALRDGCEVDALAALAQLGFDEGRLRPLAPLLPAAARILLAPLLDDTPIGRAPWSPGAALDRLLGDGRWLLRVAAPPELLLLVRTLHGVLRHLRTLDVELPLFPLVLHRAHAEVAQLRADLRPRPTGAQGPGEEALGTRLRVAVLRAGALRASAELPLALVGELPALVPPGLRSELQRAGVRLEAVVAEVRAREGRPGSVFDGRIGGDELRIWLERAGMGGAGW